MESKVNAVHREPWNKGKIVGQKAPFKLKDIWALRVRQSWPRETEQRDEWTLLPRARTSPVRTGASMSRRPRRTHSAAFKAKVALEDQLPDRSESVERNTAMTRKGGQAQGPRLPIFRTSPTAPVHPRAFSRHLADSNLDHGAPDLLTQLALRPLAANNAMACMQYVTASASAKSAAAAQSMRVLAGLLDNLVFLPTFAGLTALGFAEHH